VFLRQHFAKMIFEMGNIPFTMRKGNPRARQRVTVKRFGPRQVTGKMVEIRQVILKPN
jgi:hypothetical protein